MQFLILITLLTIVSITDIKRGVIPNKILIIATIPLLLFEPQFMTFLFTLIFFVFVTSLNRLLFKKATLGGGDIKLFLVISLTLAPRQLLTAIFVASLLAILYMGSIRKNFKKPLRFGPFIAIGTLIAYFL